MHALAFDIIITNYITVPALLLMGQTSMNFGDIHKNIIVNFPQLQGTPRSNLVNLSLTTLLIHEVSVQ